MSNAPLKDRREDCPWKEAMDTDDTCFVCGLNGFSWRANGRKCAAPNPPNRPTEKATP